MNRLVATIALAGALATASHAETRLGPELRVSPAIQDDQYGFRWPRVAHIGNGAFAVTWVRWDRATQRSWVFVRQYSADGRALSGAKLVGRGGQTDIAPLAGGGYVVVLNGADISGRIYSNSGVPVTELFRVTGRDGVQGPAVAPLSGGGFIVVFQDTATNHIVGRRFTSNGKPLNSHFRISQRTVVTTFPVVAPFGNDGFVAAWMGANAQGSTREVFARQFSGSGPASSEFQVNTYELAGQRPSAVVALAGGGFVIVWTSAHAQDGSANGVYARRYDQTATAVGEPFQVNTTTDFNQDSAVGAGLTDGGFVIAWRSARQDGSGAGIYAQRYAANGDPVGGEFKVNNYTTRDQESPAIAPLLSGEHVITWHSFRPSISSIEVFGQRFGP